MAKALSLKLDDADFKETEKIRKKLRLPRNTYIRKAIAHFNTLYTRKALEKDYRNATARLAPAHLAFLQETETLEDLPEEL